MVPVCDVIPSRSTPFVTIGLIAATTLVFLYELGLDRRELYQLARLAGVVPAEFAWFRVVTSVFLHEGWVHFGANMLCLWIFGGTVEDVMGSWGYLLFYVSSAAAGSAAHASMNPASAVPLIGASGAVAGLMGAYFVLYPRSRLLAAVFLIRSFDLVEVPAIALLGLWVLLHLFSGLAPMRTEAFGLTAFTALAAGFAAGGFAGLMLRARGRRWD